MMTDTTTGTATGTRAEKAEGMDRVLILVDIQNDFCEGGALGVDGGHEVARRAAAFVRENGREYDAIVVSQDHHRGDGDNGGHFSESPDFVDTWPPHCVVGTEGEELAGPIAELAGEGIAGAADAPADAGSLPPILRVLKGHGEPAYSALEGTIGTVDGTPLAHVLAGARSVDVAGLALDYCVAATARDARALGADVRVLRELTAPVHPEGVDDLVAGLTGRGIAVVAADGTVGSAGNTTQEED